MGQTPVTVGLFFSLGHSTIVIAMTVAVIITTAAIDKLPDVASIGGVIGVSVSASFLFLLAVINSVMLWQTIRVARKRKQLRAAAAHASNAPLPDAPAPDSASDAHILSKKLSTTSDASGVLDEEASIAEAKRQEQEAERDTMPGLPATTCIGRIGRPLFRMINRPWKMYPVGVLFGLGFDTASEISLLGISALASAGPHKIPAGEIILLPLLFTAGMTAVDSLDSVFMLTAYTVPQRAAAAEAEQGVLSAGVGEKKPWYRRVKVLEARPSEEDERQEVRRAAERARMLPQADEDKLLNISVVLTVISIVVALLISITEFMGLALEKCAKCSDAADNDPGLAGRWWRFWAAVNDNSGYLGAGVVGLFLVVFLGWGGVHLWNKRKEKREGKKAAFRI
ncbi:hypothetical protein Rhopal_005799-T1 [Rhodotorula paludigena]|uniref:Nickel/cobalt efflux system n=1 Tax=Rhodotorula paludigena TaxID=86838 RepID=A0AAV5GJF4_9BASI|nr:hypothetical protein Rhopal_005799-T1 [Rhodotorula paludigena]